MTPTEARDEILTLFTTAWNAQVAPVPTLIYMDDPENKPTFDEFARATMKHNNGGNGSIGNKCFDRSGIVTIQLFTAFGEGLSRADVLSKVAMDAFQGKYTPGGAWFRNVRMNEIGPDGEWFHTNVLAEFEYTERVS